jgi:hypothetical protein
MYDVSLVTSLCETIVSEQDGEKARDLLDLLRAVVHGNNDEIGLRLEFLKNKYAFALITYRQERAAVSSANHEVSDHSH